MESITAKNIKKIIRNSKYKQSAIADLAGYNYRTFSNMLNGRKVITDTDVMNIANALEVEPNDLYGIKSS
ncbi:helix-turn-helix domain-containing protein [Murimonas intestini]|uniref:helix-turn-helix domain-containing protein n=1 Tax=Murimonas intestini TaxID=1337051 RepID=UPI00248BDFFD|nr:helix-turn-helix transcriptional regulator [Murimonas intestini]